MAGESGPSSFVCPGPLEEAMADGNKASPFACPGPLEGDKSPGENKCPAINQLRRLETPQFGAKEDPAVGRELAEVEELNDVSPRSVTLLGTLLGTSPVSVKSSRIKLG
jgi:hypothetical protein